jgi:DNA-binding NarL/FixJ family response regulator
MTIAIVDDHKLMLQALKAQIEELQNIKSVRAFTGAEDFLKHIKTETCDYVFLDIQLGESNGFDILKELKSNGFGGKIIMLSGNISSFTLNKAIQEGANGFVGKDADMDELAEAIEVVEEGEFYVGRTLGKIARELLTQRKKSTLSDRETEIVQMIAQGLSYKEIGEKLFISARTVEAHRNNILEKLNLKTVTELIHFALKNHLI